jgi:hypothetical protein
MITAHEMQCKGRKGTLTFAVEAGRERDASVWCKGGDARLEGRAGLPAWPTDRYGDCCGVAPVTAPPFARRSEAVGAATDSAKPVKVS